MDGIFVMYHNTKEIFGFEYVTLKQMEQDIFGNSLFASDSFNLSIKILQGIFDHVTAKYPKKDCHLFLLNCQENYLTLFASPDPFDEIPSQVSEFLVTVNSKINGSPTRRPFVSSPLDKWTIDFKIDDQPLNRNKLKIALDEYCSRNVRMDSSKMHTYVNQLKKKWVYSDTDK